MSEHGLMSSAKVDSTARGAVGEGQDQTQEAPLTDQLRVLEAPWPFLYSVVSGRGMVRNLPVGSKPPVERVSVTPMRQAPATSVASRRRGRDDDELKGASTKRVVPEIALNWKAPIRGLGSVDD